MRFGAILPLLACAAAADDHRADKELAAERARLHVWQGKFAEAKADADRAVSAGDEAHKVFAARSASAKTAVLARVRAERVRVAKLRLHAKDLDARADAEWDQVKQLNETLRILSARPVRKHEDLEPSLRAIRLSSEPSQNSDEADAAREATAEVNATTLRQERIALADEVTTLREEEKKLAAQVSSTEKRAWALKVGMKEDTAHESQADPLANVTKAIELDVAEMANLTAESKTVVPTTVPLVKKAPAADMQAVSSEAVAVAKLEQQLVISTKARAEAELERTAHLASVEQMNATLAKLEDSSGRLTAQLNAVQG